MRSFMTFVPPRKRYSGYENLKKNDIWGACVAVGESGVAYDILEGTSAGRIPMVRPRHKRENDIEMDHLHIR